MAMESENYKALSELFSTILAPMHETQDKQAQALVLSAQQIQKLADLLQSEPTRQVMIEAMRGFLNTHNDEIKRYLDSVTDRVCQALSQHNESCTSRSVIQATTNTSRDTTMTATLAKLVNDSIDPAKKLVESWDRIKWEVRLYFIVGASLAGWIIWIYHHLPSITVTPIP
jgi:hypothetical protein